ncbi:unnamed protein product [Pleuronectes platessa]|uniref:Uncharacterized protein n=1 Tax=Pleuronectes platessa TaxID=8262 RepID=A0A9N7UD87_PLEPL|nr:unnamed protein product [Pleuronectes platessa]
MEEQQLTAPWWGVGEKLPDTPEEPKPVLRVNWDHLEGQRGQRDGPRTHRPSAEASGLFALSFASKEPQKAPPLNRSPPPFQQDTISQHA